MNIKKRKHPIPKFNIAIIYYLYLPFIIISKIIRYSIMKSVLVDTSAGWGILEQIKFKNYGLAYLGSKYTGVAATNTAFVFSFFYHLGVRSFLGYEILITILWNIFFLLILKKLKKSQTIESIIFISLTITALNIFDFNLSKEPLQMIMFIGLFYILNHNYPLLQKTVLSFVLIGTFTLIYRVYYILIIYFAVVSYLFIKIIIGKRKRIKFFHIIIYSLIIILSYYLFLNIVQFLSPLSYAELIRVRLRTSDATTDIAPLINSNNVFLSNLNYPIALIRMMFPLELISKGAKYLPYVILQLIITKSIIDSLKFFNSSDSSQKLCSYIIWGFIFASCTFEPDFGSWLRHEAIMIPLLFITNRLTKSSRANKHSDWRII